MKGKICVENLCSCGAFIHTQMCSLCVGGSEPGWTPAPGAGNWFPNIWEAKHSDEIASDHWLKIKCLQENQPRQITTGPKLQVTVVMPQRPLTSLFRQGIQYSSSWQIAHMKIRYLCKPVPGFPQGTFKISWVGVRHWCIFKNFGPCNKQGKDYLGSWLCPDMLGRGGALQALLHKSQSPGTEYSQTLDSSRALRLCSSSADGVCRRWCCFRLSSSPMARHPPLACFLELLEAIFLLGNAISTKPCKSSARWRRTVLCRGRHFAHLHKRAVCWLW